MYPYSLSCLETETRWGRLGCTSNITPPDIVQGPDQIGKQLPFMGGTVAKRSGTVVLGIFWFPMVLISGLRVHSGSQIPQSSAVVAQDAKQVLTTY